MRRTVLFTALAFAAGTAIAQQNMGDMKGMDMSGQKAMPGAAHKAIGVVKKIDAKTGMVTFAHGPVKSLNWPAMTMGFAVKDKALFDKLAVGKKVEFEFVKEGEGYTVTSVK
ncbi:copper-binding protein [Thiobacillus sp.]